MEEHKGAVSNARDKDMPEVRRRYSAVVLLSQVRMAVRMSISEFLVTLALAIGIDEGKAQFQKLKKKFKECYHK
jgi:hypothetical protein